MEKYDYRLELPWSHIESTCQISSHCSVSLQRLVASVLIYAQIGRKWRALASDVQPDTGSAARWYRDVFNPALPTFQLAFREEDSERCVSAKDQCSSCVRNRLNSRINTYSTNKLELSVHKIVLAFQVEGTTPIVSRRVSDIFQVIVFCLYVRSGRRVYLHYITIDRANFVIYWTGSTRNYAATM